MTKYRKHNNENRYLTLSIKELERRIFQAKKSLKRINADRESKNLKLMKKALKKKISQNNQSTKPQYNKNLVSEDSYSENGAKKQPNESDIFPSGHPWVSQLTHIITDDDLDGITAGAILLHEAPHAKIVFSNTRKLRYELKKIRSNYSFDNPTIAIADIGIDGQDIDKLKTEIKKLIARGGRLLYLDHHTGSETLSLNKVYASKFNNFSSTYQGSASIIAGNLTQNPNTWRLAILGAVSDRAISFRNIPKLIQNEVTTLQRTLSYPDFPEKLIRRLAYSPNEWLFVKPSVQEIAHEAEKKFQEKFRKVLANAKRTDTKHFCVLLVDDALSEKIDGLAGVMAAKVAYATRKIALVLYSSERHAIPGKENDVYNFSARSHNGYNVNILKTIEPTVQKNDGNCGGHPASLGGWLPKDNARKFINELDNLKLISLEE